MDDLLDDATITEKIAKKVSSTSRSDFGLLRASAKRSLDLMSLGAWLGSQGIFPKASLQVYAGKGAHILQIKVSLCCRRSLCRWPRTQTAGAGEFAAGGSDGPQGKH